MGIVLEISSSDQLIYYGCAELENTQSVREESVHDRNNKDIIFRHQATKTNMVEIILWYDYTENLYQNIYRFKLYVYPVLCFPLNS